MVNTDCAACARPEWAEKMVQCDKCDLWYHFTCAGVTDSITHRDWMCRKCLPVVASSRSGSTATRSSERERKNLELERLKEEQQLRRKRFLLEKAQEQKRLAEAAEKKKIEEELALEESFIQEKYELLVKQISVEEGRESVVNKRSSYQKSVDKVNEWINHVENKSDGNSKVNGGHKKPSKTAEGQSNTSIPDKRLVGTKLDDPTRIRQQPDLNSFVNDTSYSDSPQSLVDDASSYDERRTTATSDASINDPPGAFSYNASTIDQCNDNKRRGARTKEVLPPRQKESRHNHQQYRALTNKIHNLGIAPDSGPSSAQIAARRVMTRDLPEFYGNPEDWPIFISQFNITSECCGFNDAENLVRLQRSLKGHALESVRSRLLLPQSVPHVIETLRMLYGRPELLIKSLIQRVRNTPAPKMERLETLIEFGTELQSLCDHLMAANQEAHLSNPSLLQDLEDKLPSHLKLQWAMHKIPIQVVTLKNFADFMSHLVTAASQVTSLVGCSGDRRGARPKQKTGFLHSHCDNEEVEATVAEHSIVERNCMVCNQPNHRVKDCEKFRSLSVQNRWHNVLNLKLCRCCLNQHGRKRCRFSSQCGIEGCTFKHHPLLHAKSENGQNYVADSHTHREHVSKTLFRVVPVTLQGKKGSVNTFAFLDDGSSLTLVEQSIANQLGERGPSGSLILKWTSNVTRCEPHSEKISFEIAGPTSGKSYRVQGARTVAALNLPVQSLDIRQLNEQYPHLKGLPIQDYNDAVPTVLIGLDQLKLSAPLKCREGRGGEPVATKTRLGWCVYGGSNKNQSSGMSCHVTELSEKDLHEMVKLYFGQEDTGVKSSLTLETTEESRAREILENTTVRVADHFETGLLWRFDNFEFPESYQMALRRLECLERKMIRNPTLKNNLHNQIKEYQAKGYCHRATKSELANAEPRRTWYLPLGAVVNPRKPGKVRIIWDAAATVDGISLNSVLLKGPDQLSSLSGVLFRFRQRPVAVSGDIREMFHQIRIRPVDRDAQRFLWREHPTCDPDIYLMDVATFGSTCSPCSAQFIKNKNAAEFAEDYPRAAEAITKSHYVDDYLDSFDTIEEAKKVTAEVKMIHKKGGFEIRSWLSNAVEVVEGLGETTTTAVKDLNLDKSDVTERVLGMLWLPEADELGFSTQMRKDITAIVEDCRRPTKRQVLRCVMSLFDPLGLLSAFLIHGKVLIQVIWRSGIDWDDQIEDEAFERWKKWINLIPLIDSVRIPRCYLSNIRSNLVNSTQLHVFVDASEDAYSCVAYLRFKLPGGKVSCSLVSAKTKVAPLKPLSIPRLELQAAVLGSRLAKFIGENHTISIERRFFWTDSRVTFAWITANSRRYRQYVMFRCGEIRTLTSVSEWMWIPTKLNIADQATKWGNGPCFSASGKWFNGPDFLYHSEIEWPDQQGFQRLETQEELRPCYVHAISTEEPLIDFNRFSRWVRLLRSVAYVRRFTINIRKTSKARMAGPLSKEELIEAKNIIWRICQFETYPDECIILRSKNKHVQVEKTSPLYRFSPYADENGVLRQDGRIGAAEHAEFDTKFPVLLPKRHRVTTLLLDEYHRKLHHVNQETVVNEVRQQFKIPELRVAVRKVFAQCQWCRIYKAQPVTPRMAPLPFARMASFARPFSYVGVDYFGPILVKLKRSIVKRWVSIFTCLTIRAVHLEVVHEMSTESCIMCFRRFVDRRGAPLEVHSDNGTNFHGAERKLREQINSGLEETFTNEHTKWLFNPPSAPHMGGAWERMVRSVKTAMESINTGRKLNDEEFLTLIAEAESIVNCRPLTYLPLDSAEQEALTPNHFLLGSSDGVKQPVANTTDHRAALKSSWNQIRHQLDIFWNRWLREYLPTICRRTKWFEDTPPVRVGDLVMIADGAKRNSWLRGRIVEVRHGADGKVRRAFVQTTTRLLKRPVSKLAILDVEDSGKTAIGTQCYGGGDVATAPNDTGHPTGNTHQPIRNALPTPFTTPQVTGQNTSIAIDDSQADKADRSITKRGNQTNERYK